MATKPRQKRKVERVMHEYEEGELKSGSDRKVKSRKQAVAIAMSESGQSRNKAKRGTTARKKMAARTTTSRRKRTTTTRRKRDS